MGIELPLPFLTQTLNYCLHLGSALSTDRRAGVRGSSLPYWTALEHSLVQSLGEIVYEGRGSGRGSVENLP